MGQYTKSFSEGISSSFVQNILLVNSGIMAIGGLLYAGLGFFGRKPAAVKEKKEEYTPAAQLHAIANPPTAHHRKMTG
jgi:hypothetical protein